MAEEENTIDLSKMLAAQKPYGAGYDTTRANIPEVTATAPRIGGGRGLAGGMRTWEAPASGFEWRDLGGIGDPIRVSNKLDVHWTDMPTKEEREQQAQLPASPPQTGIFGGTLGPKIKQFAKVFGLNAAMAMFPQLKAIMMVRNLVKGFQQNPKGLLTSLALSRLGPNADIGRGIFSTLTGSSTPGQAFGDVLKNRGMRAGMQGLMKAAYKQGGVPAVQLTNTLMKTLMQKGGGPP
jgi:hypothetical protein